MVGVIGLVIFLLFLAVTLYQCVRIVPQADQWVVERLGKYHTTLNPV